MHIIQSKFILPAKGGEYGLLSGTFGGRRRAASLACSTVKGTTASSIGEAICFVLETTTGRNVSGRRGVGSLAR